MENYRYENDNKQMCHFCIQRCIYRWADAIDVIEFHENDIRIAAAHAHANQQFKKEMYPNEEEIRANGQNQALRYRLENEEHFYSHPSIRFIIPKYPWIHAR